jgi:hypothetical protein
LEIKAAKGWFDSAYTISTFEKSPFGRDSEIERIMQDFEDRVATDPAWERRYRSIVRTGYVKGLIAKARGAELSCVRYVRQLADAGQLQAALTLNAYARELFDGISQETGATTVNSVTAEAIAGNEVYTLMGRPSQ